jgi:hypothetical protein
MNLLAYIYKEANVRVTSIIFSNVLPCKAVQFHQPFEGTHYLHRRTSTGLYGVTPYKTIFAILNVVRIWDPTNVTSFHNHPPQTIPTNVTNTQSHPIYCHVYE